MIYVRRVKKYSLVKLLFLAAFLAYIVGVMSQTLFPIYIDSDLREMVGQNTWSHVNITPLTGLAWSDARASFLNIVLFLPFGFFLPLLFRNNTFSQVLPKAIIFSVSIEALQLILALLTGFTFRYIDINDVIFNTFGTLIGYTVFLTFGKIFQAIINKYNLEMNPVLIFLDESTKRFTKNS